MKKSTLAVALTLLSFMVISLSITFAQGPGMIIRRERAAHQPKQQPTFEQMLANLSKELNLTSDQTNQIRQIHTNFLNNNQADLTRAKTLHQQIVSDLKEPGTYRVDDALAAHRELRTVMDRLGEASIRALFDAKRVLTVDQQRRLGELIDAHRKNGSMHPWMGCMCFPEEPAGGMGKPAQ